MNGYAALHEPSAEVVDEGAGRSVVAGVGTVHAARTLPDGHTPAAFTLCGLDTNDLEKTPPDVPGDRSDSWVPPGRHVRRVCGTCDERVAAGA